MRRCSRVGGSSPQAPAPARRHSTTASGTSAAAITAARCAQAPGASTRYSGIEKSARSNSACSRIVGSNPKRRKIAAQSSDGTTSSTRREYGGKSRVVGVRGAEDDRLQHERDGDPEPAPAEMRADQRAQRERHGAKQALLHEPGLQRHGDRHQRRHGGRQDVGIGQHLGGLPPAEPSVRRVVERGDQRELERDEQVAADRAAQHRARRAAFARPDPPQLRLQRERAARQAFRGHEHQRVRRARRPARRQAAAPTCRSQNVVADCAVSKPNQAPGDPASVTSAISPPTTRPARSAGRTASQCFRASHSTPRMQPADAVEQARRHAGDPRDRVVRAAELVEPALERLGDVDVRRDLDQLVAGDGQPQPDPRFAERCRHARRRTCGRRVRRAASAAIARAGRTARDPDSSPPSRAPRRAHAPRRGPAPSSPRRARTPRAAGARSRSTRRPAGSGSSPRSPRRA